MHMLPLPLTREIVLIGGGHAHALLLRRWGMAPLPGARLTLINPGATAPYTGMLPGFVAGHYGRYDLEIDLVRLARFAGARMIFGRVEGMDLQAQRLHVAGRAPLAYDLASLDIGITSAMPEIPGFTDHAIAAKPLGPFAQRWSAHLADGGGPVAVIGGGIAGVELALAMAHAMGGGESVQVIEAETALSGVGDSARRVLLDEMRNAGITLFEGATVAQIAADGVTLSDGQTVPATLTVGAAGARPFPWLENTGLTLTDGFVDVDDTLRSVNAPAVFAVGDCAHLTHAPRPKAGVFAVRAAPVLTHNLAATASGGAFRAFKPQSHYLKLVSLGRRAALADKWGRTLRGDWVWRWKDRIDQAFMSKLDDLPAMARPSLPTPRASDMDDALGPKPLCGGCGAKVGSGILDQVLSDLPMQHRDDVILGAGDDAAVLAHGDQRQVLTTDHLRAFWDDPWTFARVAAFHALGDIWAMGATPQAALAQVTLPPLSAKLQRAWLAEVMASAAEAFGPEGAVIAGGHSTLGSEFVLGFALSGVVPGVARALTGATAGDAILLTRPIGSGTILAAEMEQKARGGEVEALLETLATSQGDAARYLAGQATAMTDVTGFGLAGHLSRMAQASGVTAVIDPARVPLFDGAARLAESGVRSSIWAANRASVEGQISAPGPDLLYDPQTAGGLLAALPAHAAPKAEARLRDMGHDAALIGQFEPAGSVSLRLLPGDP